MSEHTDQVALFQWAGYNTANYPELELLFAVPNGTRTSIAVAAKMKAEGVKKGVPDIFLPCARGEFNGLFIEMKSLTNYPGPEQRKWIDALMKQNYYATVCHGWEQAVAVLTNYLNLPG
jgi:hypothetical protein